MAADHQHTSLSIVKALEKKLALENAIALNKHLNAGIEETEERANFCESMTDGVINKLGKLERMMEWIADAEERSFVIMEDMNRCVDEMDRLSKEVTDALEKSEKAVQTRANKMLERMFIESRQKLQNEKEALLFVKLQEHLEIETRECEEIMRNIQELRQKHEQQKDESAAVLRQITACERLCVDLKTELDDKHKLKERLTKETDKSNVVLAELQAEESFLRSLIPSSEAQREAEENKQRLVLEVEAMERLADEVETKYEKLVAKQDEEFKEIELQYKACEDKIAHENAALQIQLTEAEAECHRVELIKKSAERRLEAMKRKLEKEHGHVPHDEEMEDILKKRALDRENQLESREELFHLEKAREAKRSEAKEKMAIIETQHQQKVVALELKRNTLLKRKNDLDSQLEKQEEVKKTAERLKETIALLEREKTALEEKIRAQAKDLVESTKETSIATPRITNGDSDTTEPALSMDVMEHSSSKAILIKGNHQTTISSPFLCPDEPRSYGPCVNNSVFWRFEKSSKIVRPQRGPSSDIFDHSMSSDEFYSGDADSGLVLKVLRPRRGPSSDIFDSTLDSTTENEDATMKKSPSSTSLHNLQLNEVVQPKTEESCDIFDALAATFSEETEIENSDCDGSDSCMNIHTMKQPSGIKEEFAFHSHFPLCRRFFTLP